MLLKVENTIFCEFLPGLVWVATPLADADVTRSPQQALRGAGGGSERRVLSGPHLLHVDPLHLSFILVSHLTTWARREVQKEPSLREPRG